MIAHLLNELVDESSDHEAIELLLRCCACHEWVHQMLGLRPFESDEAVFNAASEIWFGLSQEDWREAFDGHPKIGDIASLRAKYADTEQWANNEQSGVRGAAEETLLELARLNEEYEQKFGFIFIVCATGKSAAEMLEILKQRIHHEPDHEVQIAAQEQDKITRIRLEKLS